MIHCLASPETDIVCPKCSHFHLVMQDHHRHLAVSIVVTEFKKKIPRQGTSTGLPQKAERPNHVWTWDFIFDRTDKGTSLKMMTMLDEYTRRCLAIRPARLLTSHHVLETVSQVMALYGQPDYIRSDNGSEFIAQKVQTWLRKNRIKTIYIDPGSPWQLHRKFSLSVER